MTSLPVNALRLPMESFAGRLPVWMIVIVSRWAAQP